MKTVKLRIEWGEQDDRHVVTAMHGTSALSGHGETGQGAFEAFSRGLPEWLKRVERESSMRDAFEAGRHSCVSFEAWMLKRGGEQ